MNTVVIGMGYPSATLRAGVGIPCAALLADVQRRSLRLPTFGRRSGQAERSGWLSGYQKRIASVLVF